MRVLHVVDKFHSGVGTAIQQYARSLPEVEHHLLSGAPAAADEEPADIGHFVTTHRMAGGHLAKTRRVREVVRELRPDVVHAHSSHAGGYVRLAVSRHSVPIVYTPHCYAFERLDVRPPVRGAFWLAEAVLAVNTSVFAGCSVRERDLSDWVTRPGAQRYVVPNIAPPLERPHHERTGRPVVVGGGRLSAQKDPGFFLRHVEGLRSRQPDLRAVWLGGGESRWRDALAAGGVEVTGWLPRTEVLRTLGTADLYLHSALWEGFPLMVAEAVAMGVPTLVRRLPCFADVPDPLTVQGPDDLAAAVSCLQDPAAAAANLAGWSRVLSRNTPSAQRAALIEAYTGSARCRAGRGGAVSG